jgi:aspartate aminotransferase
MDVTQAARELRQQGVDVIGLGAGEPDFDTPEHIKEAAIKAIKAGETNYTTVDGIGELKEQIQIKFQRDNELSYSPSQISVAPGGKPVLFNAFAATLDVGDEVIIPAPCWVSYPEMVRLVGGTPVIIGCEAKTRFKITPEALERAITPKTKWLILNSPSNPTGAAYRRGELIALGEVLLRHPNILILMDDIYEHLVYDGFKFATLAQAVPALYDRVLTMNGVSKAYAMTGWRIGYAGGPEWLIKAMAKVMAQTTSNACSISQWAATAALSGDHSFLKEWKAAYSARRDFVVDALNAVPDLHCLTPDGAFYVYPDCRQMIGKKTPQGDYLDSDKAVAKALLTRAHVALVPGTAFHSGPNLRLSYAADMDSLKTACARIAAFAARLTT